MNPKWAEENLQTIRTLMERSALYRRALAPIMLLAGALGIIAATAGLVCQLHLMWSFGLLWLGTATLVVVSAFFIARRQAIRDKEIFWSPPTRRVGHALFPPLFAGMFLGVLPTFLDVPDDFALPVTFVWILFYGCALQTAGFFMPRGIRFFGCLLIASACFLFLALGIGWIEFDFNAHWFMGFFFGVLHLAYGAYLYLTEKKNPAA